MDQEQLKVLKTRAQWIETRLNRLERRIREVQQGPGIPLHIAVVDSVKCLGCGICETACPSGGVIVNKTAFVNPARCTGCGRCAEECPQGAITLRHVILDQVRQTGATTEIEVFKKAVKKGNHRGWVESRSHRGRRKNHLLKKGVGS